jgi:hypothetical protein
MQDYQPPFEDRHVESIARSRGLLAPGASLLDGLERVAHAWLSQAASSQRPVGRMASAPGRRTGRD